MRKYRNVKTGIEIETYGQIQGENWQEMKAPASFSEKGKKTARSRKVVKNEQLCDH